MKRFLVLFLFLSLPFSPQAQACSLASAAPFKPTLERWEPHPGPKQQDPAAPGGYWEKLPKPLVKVMEVRRGTGEVGHLCGDFGAIALEVSLPENSSYEIEDFGIYTRVIGGTDPGEIFPAIPLVGFAENGKTLLYFHWLDAAPDHLKPLDMNVELFLVTNGLDIGPSTFFQINNAVGGN